MMCPTKASKCEGRPKKEVVLSMQHDALITQYCALANCDAEEAKIALQVGFISPYAYVVYMLIDFVLRLTGNKLGLGASNATLL